MKTKLILAMPLLAVLAIPGEASQPIAQSIPLSHEHRLLVMQAQGGVAVDPHAMTTLSFSLPADPSVLDPARDPFAG